MNKERRERIMKRYGFEAWAGEAGPREKLYEARMNPELLSGWKLEHADVAKQPDQPPRTRSLWTRGEPGQEQILSIDIWECDSITAAREFLLEALDQFESPEVERVQGVVGDVAFTHGEYALLYSRANLVVLVRNAGRELTPVAGPARELDARLVGGREPQVQ